LKHLLETLAEQETAGLFLVSLVVVDNDQAESAREVVRAFASEAPFNVAYFVEPCQSFALARNLAVAQANGDFVAFIDDDEFASKRWLLNLFSTCITYNAAGVLGPVKPHFPLTPPDWLVKGKFAERAAYKTGHVMDWRQSRTGNVLFNKEIIRGEQQTFRTQFGTGGEDVDFFQRMMKKGFVFVWCNEADVFEEVPPDRCTRRYHLRRALLRGKNTFEREGINVCSLGKSFLALGVYTCTFPFLLFSGEHRLMKYAIKCSDHAGKILALLGVNPVSER
jgi:glycosyltransferase involved in cell wall biosynthesis